jgi:pimeloyl-ACP methyl ester carboxylesterase
VLLGLLLPWCVCAASEVVLEYSEEPRPESNFLEARFRFVLPEGVKRPKGLLVLLQGTDSDGRNMPQDPFWQKAGKDLQAGLLACFFRGEGRSYEDPSQGSGDVLLRAIDFFSKENGEGSFNKLPLLIWGHSAGGQFACHFACWKPERTAAFVLIKAGPYACEPDARARNVAGMFVAGERDTPGRIRGIVQGYEKGRVLGAPWAFLYEKQSGHELGKTNEVALPFLKEALARKASSDWQAVNVERGSVGQEKDRASEDPAEAFFPGPESAGRWEGLHRPSSLQILASLPDPPATESLVRVEPRQIQWEAAEQESAEQLVRVAPYGEGIVVKTAVARPSCFVVTEETKTSEGLSALKIRLDPRGLPWGPVRGEVRLVPFRHGAALEAVELPLYADIQGPIGASPKSLFFGVVKKGEQAERSLVLQSASGPVPTLNFETKGMADMEVVPSDFKGELGRKEYVCRFKPQGRLGTCSGEIRVYLEGKTDRWLRVPCFGYVQP